MRAERLALATGLGLLGRYEDAARAIEAAAQSPATGRPAPPAPSATAGCGRGGVTPRARVGAGTRPRRRGRWRGGAGAARAPRSLAGDERPLWDALDTVEPLAADAARDAVPAGVRAVAGETTVLAFAYLGQSERARDALAALARTGAVADGRHTYLGALLAQLAGREADALGGYRRAYEQAARDGDVHTVASVALNLGALLAEQGLYGEALAASERAVRELGRLGAGTELATALVNGANIFVQIGDLSAARRALDRARGLATERKLALALAAATFVEGDLALRAGQAPAAAAALP